MRKHRQLQRSKAGRDERGMVAIITVVFFALIIATVTISYVRLSVTEQRSSTDDNLTKRAFYAAESGIEDAKIALSKYIQDPTSLSADDIDPENCEPANGASGQLVTDAGVEAEYTCQLIDIEPPEVLLGIPAWQSASVLLPDGVSSISINWHIAGEPYDTGPGARAAGSNSLPQLSAWTYPAMLRLQFYGYATGGAESRSGLNANNYVQFLNPVSGGGGGDVTYNSSVGFGGAGNPLRPSNCSYLGAVTAGDYRCTKTIIGFASGPALGRRHYVSISSLYLDTDVRITAFDAGGNPLDFIGTQALVDVTGRAGDVFRRVEARISMLANDLPAFALVSAESICKDFYITNNPQDWIDAGSTLCL